MAQVTFNLTQNDDPDIRELADRELPVLHGHDAHRR